VSVVISWIGRESVAVPFLARVVVELRIGKKPKAENARWFAINLFVDPGRFRCDLLVQPETEVRIGFGGGAEAGLVDETEGLETLAALVSAVIKHLEQVEQPVAVLRNMIPENFGAAAPNVPGIASHDFVLRELNAAIHRLEDIRGDLREVRRGFASELRLVLDQCFFFFVAAGWENKQRRQRDNEGSRQIVEVTVFSIHLGISNLIW